MCKIEEVLGASLDHYGIHSKIVAFILTSVTNLRSNSEAAICIIQLRDFQTDSSTAGGVMIVRAHIVTTYHSKMLKTGKSNPKFSDLSNASGFTDEKIYKRKLDAMNDFMKRIG